MGQVGDGCMDRWMSRGGSSVLSALGNQAWTWTLGRGLALDLPSSDHRWAKETNSFPSGCTKPAGHHMPTLPAPALAWPQISAWISLPYFQIRLLTPNVTYSQPCGTHVEETPSEQCWGFQVTQRCADI